MCQTFQFWLLLVLSTAFDPADHTIVKLEEWVGLSGTVLKSYLQDREHFVSAGNYESE